MVDWCGKNYAASISDSRINAVAVVVASKDYEALRRLAHEAVRFHIEGCASDGDTMPEWALSGDYALEFEPCFSAVLHNALQYTTLSALSRVTGIKHAQLSHYANAVSRPRDEQRRRIIEGMHKIGNACLSV